MADGMEDIDVQDPPENPKQTALTLWMAGSSADVEQWIRDGAIPITGWASPQKGRYVGFRDSPDRAAERHKERCSKERKPFSKEDMLFLDIHLEDEAYVKMSTNKSNEPRRGWAMGLHYVIFKGVGRGGLVLHGKAIRLTRE